VKKRESRFVTFLSRKFINLPHTHTHTHTICYQKKLKGLLILIYIYDCAHKLVIIVGYNS